MAFTASAIKVAPFGDKWALTGKFTATAGDTSGSVTVGGALVHHADFTAQDGIAGENTNLENSVSTNSTTGISTATVSLSGKAITNGRFFIVYN